MTNTIGELEALKAIEMDAGEVFSGQKSGCKIIGYDKPGSFTPEADKNYIFHDSSRDVIVWFIAQDELRAQLTTAMYARISCIPVNVIGGKVTYSSLKAKVKSDKSARETIEKVDEIMSKIKMSLENIRTNKVEKELKKSSSSADLRIDDKTLPIEYTAQINADGQLYVEVAGLRF